MQLLASSASGARGASQASSRVRKPQRRSTRILSGWTAFLRIRTRPEFVLKPGVVSVLTRELAWLPPRRAASGPRLSSGTGHCGARDEPRRAETSRLEPPGAGTAPFVRAQLRAFAAAFASRSAVCPQPAQAMRARVSLVSREPHAAQVRELYGAGASMRCLPCRSHWSRRSCTVIAGPASASERFILDFDFPPRRRIVAWWLTSTTWTSAFLAAWWTCLCRCWSRAWVSRSRCRRSIVFAVAAERAGLVDLDPQASASKWSDLRTPESPVVTSAQARAPGRSSKRRAPRSSCASRVAPPRSILPRLEPPSTSRSSRRARHPESGAHPEPALGPSTGRDRGLRYRDGPGVIHQRIDYVHVWTNGLTAVEFALRSKAAAENVTLFQ